MAALALKAALTECGVSEEIARRVAADVATGELTTDPRAVAVAAASHMDIDEDELAFELARLLAVPARTPASISRPPSAAKSRATDESAARTRRAEEAAAAAIEAAEARARLAKSEAEARTRRAEEAATAAIEAAEARTRRVEEAAAAAIEAAEARTRRAEEAAAVAIEATEARGRLAKSEAEVRTRRAEEALVNCTVLLTAALRALETAPHTPATPADMTALLVQLKTLRAELQGEERVTTRLTNFAFHQQQAAQSMLPHVVRSASQCETAKLHQLCFDEKVFAQPLSAAAQTFWHDALKRMRLNAEQL